MSDTPPQTPPGSAAPAARDVSPTATGAPLTSRRGSPQTESESRWHGVFREITSGSAIISVLAVVLALLVGAIMIAVTNDEVQKSAGYFFSRPSDLLGNVWGAVSGAYSALFQGSIYNFGRDSFAEGITPFTETLVFATPLIAAGLGVALGFRVGLFNIGGRGQMLIAAAIGGWVAFAVDLPFGIHMVAALVAGILGGALWGGLVGLLKARTGAHEVITTIMLNYVAFYLVSYLLREGFLRTPGSNNPKSPATKETAVFPDLLGPDYNLHFGFVLVIAATIFTWWLLSRSNLGFQFRAVGENPNAARVAGISVQRMYVYAMLLSGGLVGLAGINQVLGTTTSGFGATVDSGIGFDAITVALLGRSKPWGVFAAGILFGAFKAGSFSMQAAEGVPIDIVLVVQSLIVLFIAAPPLVRAIFRLPTPGLAPRRPRSIVVKEVAAK